MKIAVLSGAGISAESGLGTFRDSGGLWEQYSIEEVATPEAWEKNPELVLNFYNQRRQQAKLANPNAGHSALVELEQFHEVNIITQNIDDLHERAGSSNVLHLHGEIFKAKTSEFDTDYITIKGDLKIGDTGRNGFQLRPHVVWFGEAVPLLDDAIDIVQRADLLIVVGTSLQVYPAASIIHFMAPTGQIILVDPKEINSSVNFTHLKTTASVGLPRLLDELSKKNKELIAAPYFKYF
ncbi:MAG: NAD-dependent deacylase [Putridiphycobacter sp.]|nr:NAD-dependent deacylase [Putridiphycobacter sp.]